VQRQPNEPIGGSDNRKTPERTASDETFPQSFSLTIIVPVYNERFLVRASISRLAELTIPGIHSIEIIAVDDGSADGTTEILEELDRAHERLRLIRHENNRGKGAALRTGIAAATGELIVINDADLEYDPRDLASLVRPFFEDGADVVYGSRFSLRERRRVIYFRHALGNKLITFLSNLATDLNLTDVETCYKMFRSGLLKSIPIRSNDFRFEVEITAKIAKRHFWVFEVPISYLGRSYQEGKKIGWKDGFRAVSSILKFWKFDDIYQTDQYGSHILLSLEKAHRFNGWMSSAIDQWVGMDVLEIGAGLGNITSQLIPRDRYLASDINPHYLQYLENYARGKPYLDTAIVDLEDPETFEDLEGSFDTVICLNVLEHVEDSIGSLRNLYKALQAQGRLVLYVPQDQRLFSSLDEALEHHRRYDRKTLEAHLLEAGFSIEHIGDFNRAGRPGWWLNGRVLRRKHLSRFQLKVFDTMTPILSRIDRFLPWRGLGLIAVATKNEGNSSP